MWWLYILESEIAGKLYIGTGKNPVRRLKFHNFGKQRWTKKFRPWEMIYKIKIGLKLDALRLERKLKKYKNPKYIKWLIDNDKIAQLVSPD